MPVMLSSPGPTDLVLGIPVPEWTARLEGLGLADTDVRRLLPALAALRPPYAAAMQAWLRGETVDQIEGASLSIEQITSELALPIPLAIIALQGYERGLAEGRGNLAGEGEAATA